MKSISELKLEDLISEENLERYKYISPMNITLADYILRYLNSRPGFIRVKVKEGKEDKDLENSKNYYYEIINKKVLAGKPIEVFFTCFNPKSKKKEITNGRLEPDMGELLSFVHLTLIGKHIREVYNPGFRFIIAYEGNYFNKAPKLSEKETEEVYKILEMYKKEAERMVGIRNVIQFVDLKEIVEKLGDGFQEKIENERHLVLKDIEQGIYNIHKTIDYLVRNVVCLDRFENEESAKKYLWDVVIYNEAYGRIKDGLEENDLGIRTHFPNTINASAKMFRNRGEKDAIRFQLLPDEVTYPYNKLMVRTFDNKWKLKTWKEIENEANYEPIYIKEIEAPFYYQEINKRP